MLLDRFFKMIGKNKFKHQQVQSGAENGKPY
jgi:hypothetical protein